MDGDLLMASIQ